ncbi:hypothetical protein PCANC_19894, partial [Puccinia coronata f. sp. avenae]
PTTGSRANPQAQGPSGPDQLSIQTSQCPTNNGDSWSQWDLIDDHLEAIRAKSDVELQAHTILVLRRDWELFTGEVMFADIPDKSIKMPGPIKLDIKVQDIMARFGVNPSPQDMSLLLESKLAPWEVGFGKDNYVKATLGRYAKLRYTAIEPLAHRYRRYAALRHATELLAAKDAIFAARRAVAQRKRHSFVPCARSR